VKGQQVVIVRKGRKDGHGGHHGGAWKVAYADFVTAMMAFFLVMWLVTQSQAVKQAVGGYFRDPGVFEHERGNSLVAMGDIKGGPEAPGSEQGAASGRGALDEAATRLKEVLGQMPEFQKLSRQIEIQVTEEGLRVELLEASDATFFDTGSAAPKPETERILAAIAKELGPLENAVVIEGHTDSRPYSRADGYSNWELSADRANAARRVMERNGLRPHQVRGVRGYADTRLLMADEAFNSRNRRVSIVVQGETDPALSKGLLDRVQGAGVSVAGDAPAPSPPATPPEPPQPR
jgi:chemotaxis protein MotB